MESQSTQDSGFGLGSGAASSDSEFAHHVAGDLLPSPERGPWSYLGGAQILSGSFGQFA